MTNPYPRMTELALSFPSMRDAPGVAPFSAVALHEWLTTSGARTSGNHHTVAFLLMVFHGQVWRKLCPFYVDDALSAWDQDHHDAFVRWVIHPWFA